MEFEGKKIMIGISAGINSAAVLCWFIEQGYQPAELHLYYAHFKEHSPDSFRFIKEQIRFARKNITNVKVKITRNSALEFFRGKEMIPHPRYSPCSIMLKIEPMAVYCWENQIDHDLIGYVKHEIRRVHNSMKNAPANLFFSKVFPINQFTDEWCFEIVEKYIGWYPAIYKIKNPDGSRRYMHNNCLPCKNETIEGLQNIKEDFPGYFEAAMQLSAELNAHWGRDEDGFYTTFGKQDYETQVCEACIF